MEETRETIEMWGTIRALWASGRYATMGALQRAASKIYVDQCPTLPAIRRRADREMWMNDDALAESMAEEQKKNATEILNELGMGLSRSIELLTDIAVKPHEDHDRIRTILDHAAKTGEIDANAIAGALKDLRALYAKGMDISLKALQIIFSLRGDVDKSGPAAAAGEVVPLDDRTPEEIEKEIDRMIRSRGYTKPSTDAGN